MCERLAYIKKNNYFCTIFEQLMPEILLHYIWQKRIWAGFPQTTTDGKPVEIVSVGQYNIHAGPDFSNAHIRIDGQDWVGNIEIHVCVQLLCTQR